MAWMPCTKVSSRVVSSAFLRISFLRLSAAVLIAGICGLGGCIGGGGSSNEFTSGDKESSGTLVPSSSSISFGNVAVGTSTAQLVSLKNTGEKDIKISSVSVSGKGLSVSGGSNTTLTPEQSVTVSVNFSPSGKGAVQGTLSISSNASKKSLKIRVTATAVAKAHTVELSWEASNSPVLGYYVYRGAAASSLSKLTGAIDPNTRYDDSSVEGGQTYVYAVTSVGSNNVESAQSSPATVTIPND